MSVLTKEEFALCHKIGERAANELGMNKVTVFMDTALCHEHAHRLRLEDYLNAPSQDFAHDVYGINAHLDHSTYKLTDLFCPRYAEPNRV